MAYGLTAVGVITRPLGSIFFGRLAMNRNPKSLLIITLVGVALSTCSIGFIPSYASIGIYSTILLLVIRIIQGIFAAGEQSIASILLLDVVEEKSRTKISSYYVASSMSGAMLASGAATIVSMSNNPDAWRYAFISGIFTGLVGFVLRYITFEKKEKIQYIQSPIYKIVNLHKIEYHKNYFCVSSFSYMTYSIPFVFFNKFIPLFNDISLTAMMSYNSILLALDILLLPLFGHIAQKYDARKWMIWTATILGITALPCFYLLSISSLLGITLIEFSNYLVGILLLHHQRFGCFSLLEGKKILNYGFRLCNRNRDIG
ncbi:MAG UNVERIFIED_CONTAM: MFS transporter [Rickettsiaceae bacterium]|jgi:MFS family permease